MVAHVTLTHSVWVQILVPQPICSHGQAVKTPPSHGGNRGSSPLGSAKNDNVFTIINTI